MEKNNCSHLPINHYFLSIQFTFSTPISNFSSALIQNVLIEAKRSFLGQVGDAQNHTDVLSVDSSNRIAVIRLRNPSNLIQFTNSLILLGEYDKIQMKISILKISPFLISFSNDPNLIFDYILTKSLLK